MSIVSTIGNAFGTIFGIITSWQAFALLICLLAADSMHRKGAGAGLRETARELTPKTNLFYVPLIMGFMTNISDSHKEEPVQKRFWQCLSFGMSLGCIVFFGWSFYRLVTKGKKGRGQLSARQTSLCAAFGISISICVLYVAGGFNMETLEYALSVPGEALEALQSLPGMLVQKITGNVQATA